MTNMLNIADLKLCQYQLQPSATELVWRGLEDQYLPSNQTPALCTLITTWSTANILKENMSVALCFVSCINVFSFVLQMYNLIGLFFTLIVGRKASLVIIPVHLFKYLSPAKEEVPKRSVWREWNWGILSFRDWSPPLATTSSLLLSQFDLSNHSYLCKMIFVNWW